MSKGEGHVRKKTLARLAAVLVVPIAALGAGIVFAANANAIANGEVVPEGRFRFSVKLTMTGIPTAAAQTDAVSRMSARVSGSVGAGSAVPDLADEPDAASAEVTIAARSRNPSAVTRSRSTCLRMSRARS